MKITEKPRKNGKYAITLAVLCALQLVFVALMSLCAMIPRGAIEKNVKKCADYYSERYMFQQMIKDENSTVVHNYADLVWLNIAWFQDNSAPLTSSLSASFYEGEDIYKSESLIKAVYDGEASDKSYSRYWHGALVFIKPLLTVTDISGIRKINAAVCALLVIILFALLIKRRLYAPLAGYIVSLAVCFSYIVPLCMEYMPAFVLMHIAGAVVLIYGDRWQHSAFCTFFAAVGALICFFDFLTNEILTLFVPLIFLLCIKDREGKTGNGAFKESFIYCFMWLFGYAFTWLVKWLLCLFVLGKSAFKEAVFDGAYRMAGAVPEIEQNQILGAVVKNINRLFPFNFLQSEADVWLATIGIVFVLFCVFFLYRKENVPKTVWILFLIACAPYARYMALSNHSCLHPFFTFRTQMITVIAVFAAFGKGVCFVKRRRKNAGSKKRANNFNAVLK